MARSPPLPDLQPYWMPFTANRYFKQHPLLLESATGMHYTTRDGRRILDGIAGLWCVNAGHCHPRIVAAVQAQVATLDYATAFNLGHPGAFELAAEVTKLAPGGLDHVFFVNSGSEAVDTALKIALAYHRARGEGQRCRFIGRERGYHGVGFGGISVGGMVANRKVFASAMLPGVDHLPHTHDLARNAFSRGQPAHGAELADALERLVALHDPSTIAGVIVEPVAGSTGVLLPPKGYLERLRAICDRHGLLLIFDEVITGFGRTGSAFGATTFGVQPDLMTVAKGITSGVVPMGAVLVDKRIYDGCVNAGNAPEQAIEFFHGYTYSGHPLACAAGLAALAVYRDEGLFERAARLAPAFEAALHSLKGLPHVIDIRNIGLMGAIELEPRPGEATLRALDVFRHCFDQGVLVRTTGDTIALTPPLVIEEAQVGQIVDVLGKALKAVH
ncbi:MAG: aspartate aminotransferase family protein [Gammaproteobacteria bacterium]|nr:aspartate aminotransferase family protein [Gammaproteobacteria bacterium]